VPSGSDLAGFLESQQLAKRAAREVASLLQEGWTEIQAATLLNTWLNDHGVRAWFHKAFVWFGERTRFDGVKTYWDYLPSKRVVRPGEVFILDVAPIVHGYICDVGYTSSLGPNSELDRAKEFLKQLRTEIPRLFEAHAKGDSVWDEVHKQIVDGGWENIHAKYPFSVLGHRVHRVRATWTETSFINFGWQSYWSFLSRGLFGQLLNGNHAGPIDGLWAVEPHIGDKNFGAKFEELLLVDNGKAQWLENKFDL
jgi:Xaa-Pro aminopeptidase